jgi:hypothetical protein
VRLDDAVMQTSEGWAGLLRGERHIGDFTGWKEHHSYQKSFDRLMRDLRVETSASSRTAQVIGHVPSPLAAAKLVGAGAVRSSSDLTATRHATPALLTARLAVILARRARPRPIDPSAHAWLRCTRRVPCSRTCVTCRSHRHLMDGLHRPIEHSCGR